MKIDTATDQERLLLSLIYLFLGLALLHLWLAQPGRSILPFALVLFSVVLWSGAVHYVLRRAAPHLDPLIFPLILSLTSLGLVMTLRLAPALYLKQLLWFLLGSLLMVLVILVPRSLRWLQRYRYSWLIPALILLAFTLALGVNPLGRGARLWLGLGGLYFQPSEFLKVVLVIFLASYLADKQGLLRVPVSTVDRISSPSAPYLAPLLLIWGMTLLLLIAQEDLGAGTLMFGTMLVMLYVASRQSFYLYGGIALLIIAGIVSYHISRFVALRVDMWLNPWLDSQGGGYQIVQSLLSLAAGGILGTGLGQGYGADYIPIVHTDFVFAAVGEELGLSGALAVLIIYVLLLYRGLRIATLASTGFERMLALGLSVSITLQAWVIAGGNLKILPLTGVTLPFVSYGGSSLTVSYITVGLLLHMSKNLKSPSQRLYGHPHGFKLLDEWESNA